MSIQQTFENKQVMRGRVIYVIREYLLLWRIL